MHPHPEATGPRSKGSELASRYKSVRQFTEELAAPLAPEDTVVQSMPDVSPTKWHLAHVTWFFERFVLCPHKPGYRLHNETFDHLFNSYYHTAGTMHARPRRGLLSRPTLVEVYAYRRAVDEAVVALIGQNDATELAFFIELGLQHEQQHQELLLTDIKHVLAQNPLQPVYRDLPRPSQCEVLALEFRAFPGGIGAIGAAPDDGFSFDNETPRHRVLLEPFALANRLVTNGEYREFMLDGGYENCALWLSDGWANVLNGSITRPLYWDEALETEFTLAGRREIEAGAPVTHLSYFEADAFARWAEARLPTEAEWETVAAKRDVAGNFVDDGFLEPVPAKESTDIGQLYGDVWEWTSTSYSAYPGFKPLAGSLGEYNGKFMCSQQVVRGGSCVSSADHLRATYRSFFYPGSRWQHLGLRLARSA